MHIPFSRPVRSALAAITVAGALLAAAAAPVGAASPAAYVAPAAHVSPAASYALFKSPSKNIYCYMDTSSVRCDILAHTYKPASKKPSWCEGDWGSSMTVGKSGKGRILCISDSLYATAEPVLQYGHSKTIGRFTCLSRTDGMRCKNNWTGHGFQLAKTKYSLF